MIERGREPTRPATVALIHAHDIHSCSQALRRDADGIAGIAGTFQTVNDDSCQGLRTIGLPMAMAKDLHAGLDFDEPFLRRSDVKPA